MGSLVEWIAAATGVVALAWLISVPAQRVLGPGVEAALVDTPAPRPPGVPFGATSVPVILMLDGREIRQGELHSRLAQILPDKLAETPIVRSNAEFGERHTRAYVVKGMKFYIVCERLEPAGPLRVSGIYLP
jgi:hypothetical protein